MKKIKIYAGGSYIQWKKQWKKLLEGAELYEPFLQSRQNCLASFTLDDLNAIDECDLILFIINYPVYSCSCIEAGYAFARGKPIITIWLLKNKEQIPPLLLGLSYSVFTDVEAGLNYIRTRFIEKIEPCFFSEV